MNPNNTALTPAFVDTHTPASPLVPTLLCPTQLPNCSHIGRQDGGMAVGVTVQHQLWCVSETMWPCVCHLPSPHVPQLLLSQLCYHDCRMGGVRHRTGCPTDKKKKEEEEEKKKSRVWRADFMSSKTKRCMSVAALSAAL